MLGSINLIYGILWMNGIVYLYLFVFVVDFIRFLMNFVFGIIVIFYWKRYLNIFGIFK